MRTGVFTSTRPTTWRPASWAEALRDQTAAWLSSWRHIPIPREICGFSFPQSVELKRGDIIFVNEDQQWFPAPNAVWPDDSSVGVVRKILDDRSKSVVETSGGGMRVLSGPQTVDVEPGNTIQYTEVDGIVDVVSSTPIRYRDTGVDEDLAGYIVKPGETPLTFDALGGYDEVKARARELIETQLGRANELKRSAQSP